MKLLQIPGINCCNQQLVILLAAWSFLVLPAGLSATETVSVHMSIDSLVLQPCSLVWANIDWELPVGAKELPPYSIQFADEKNQIQLELKDKLQAHITSDFTSGQLRIKLPFHVPHHLAGRTYRVTLGFLGQDTMLIRSDTETAKRVFLCTLSVAPAVPLCNARYLKPVFLTGCYDTENNPEGFGMTYRWLAPESLIQIPNPHSDASLLMVLSATGSDKPISAHLMLDTICSANILLTEIPTRYSIRIPADMFPAASNLNFILRTDFGFVPSKSGQGNDTRLLAIQLHHLALYPGSE